MCLTVPLWNIIIISRWNITLNSCTVWCSQMASLWYCRPPHLPVAWQHHLLYMPWQRAHTDRSSSTHKLKILAYSWSNRSIAWSNHLPSIAIFAVSRLAIPDKGMSQYSDGGGDVHRCDYCRLHDRMPVLLTSQASIDLWLSGQALDAT